MAKCVAAYEDLARAPAQRQAALDHVVKYTAEMRVILFGEAGEKAVKEEDARLLALEVAKSKLLSHMANVSQLGLLGFEVGAPPEFLLQHTF